MSHRQILAFSVPESLERTARVRQGVRGRTLWATSPDSAIVVDSGHPDLGVDETARGESERERGALRSGELTTRWRNLAAGGAGKIARRLTPTRSLLLTVRRRQS